MSMYSTHLVHGVVLTANLFMLTPATASANTQPQVSAPVAVVGYIMAAVFVALLAIATAAVIYETVGCHLVAAYTEYKHASEPSVRSARAGEQATNSVRAIASLTSVESPVLPPISTPTPRPEPDIDPVSEASVRSARAAEQATNVSEGEASGMDASLSEQAIVSETMQRIIGAIEAEDGVWTQGHNALARAANVSRGTVSNAVLKRIVTKDSKGNFHVAAKTAKAA